MLLSIGMLNTYSVLQTSVWCLCHAAALFWKICFPLRARVFTLEKKDKYLHLSCLIAGLGIPLIPIIVPIIDTAVHSTSTSSLASRGFGFQRAFLFNSCFGITKAALYSLVMPICFTVPLTVTLIILVFFYIHKVRLTAAHM